MATEHVRPRRRFTSPRWAATTLIVLTPVCAELTFGAAPLRMAWFLLPLLVPMYGAGVLLVRELVARAGGGWPSLLLLGLAYELVEDGIGLQALSSPTLYGAAEWGPRVLGLNTTYWESQIGYHITFSVLIPILLTDLLFPQHRDRPYLRRGGLVGIAVCAVLGVGIVRATVPPTMDPGYQAPWTVLLGVTLAALLLGVLALRVLPGRTPVPAGAGRAPAAVLVGAWGALVSVAFLRLLMPLGGPEPEALRPIFGSGAGALLAMTVAAALAVGTGWLVYRWSASPQWDHRHQIWLAGGALVGHTGFGAAVMAKTAFDQVGLVVLGVLTAVLLALFARRLSRRQREAEREPEQLPGDSGR